MTLFLADAVLGKERNPVATAVNGHFVPREARADTPLWPGDALIAFHAIVGG